MSQSTATQSLSTSQFRDDLAPLYHFLERDDVGELLESDISLQLLLINAACRAPGFKTNDWDTRPLARALYKITDEWMQGRRDAARRENGRKGNRPPDRRNARAMRECEREARKTRARERTTLDIDVRTPEREVYRDSINKLCQDTRAPFHDVAPTERDRSKLADNTRKVRQRRRAKMLEVVKAAAAMGRKQGTTLDGPAS